MRPIGRKTGGAAHDGASLTEAANPPGGDEQADHVASDGCLLRTCRIRAPVASAAAHTGGPSRAISPRVFAVACAA